MSLNDSLPVISIVIPMYNRAHFIARAINSCLQQDFESFEIVVVDDASADDSVKVVAGFSDSRIVLLCHGENRGVGPARNSGIQQAKGEWIVLLDSDDELLPGALKIIQRAISCTQDDISRLVFMYKLDTGGESPSPALIDEVWDYCGYIRWAATYRVHSDFCNVVRKSALQVVKFSDNRSYESLFHLDFANQFLTETQSSVVGVVHSDATNRTLNFTPKQLLDGARPAISQTVELLRKHGSVIKEISPPLYYEYIRGLITLYFISGQRMMGLRYFFQYLPYNPLQKKLWVVVMLGLIGKKYLSWAKAKIC